MGKTTILWLHSKYIHPTVYIPPVLERDGYYYCREYETTN